MAKKRSFPMSFQEWHSGRGADFNEHLADRRSKGGFDAHSATEFIYTDPKSGFVDTYDFSTRWEGATPIHISARNIPEDYMVYRAICRKKGHEPGEFEDFFHEDDDLGDDEEA